MRFKLIESLTNKDLNKVSELLTDARAYIFEDKNYAPAIDRLNEVIDILKSNKLDEDTEESEEDGGLAQSEQEFTSAKTSINSCKLPAIFRLVKFTPDTINLDYGGGKFDNAAEYLKNEFNVTNLVYDPFNRTKEHNNSTIKQIRKNGGADSATLSNVLNVIKEPEIRLEVLNNIKSLLKPGANLYITVYEGTGKGDSGETKSGYQLNRKTTDYIEEISQVFGDVSRKGKLIIAK